MTQCLEDRDDIIVRATSLPRGSKGTLAQDLADRCARARTLMSALNERINSTL